MNAFRATLCQQLMSVLNENGETKTDAAEVSEIFNDFFISTASEIGHNEDIASVPQAIDEYEKSS